jgi:hypothetical protein
MKEDLKKIVVIGVLILTLFFIYSIFNAVMTEDNKDPPNLLEGKSKTFSPPKVSSVNDPFHDISLKPVGCFENLKNQYFIHEVNQYNSSSQLDSGIIIKDDDIGKKNLSRLIETIRDNGYISYGNTLKRKMNNLSDLSIIDYATIGYLNGYKYISVYKTDLHGKGRVYFTYSPPTLSSATYKYGYNFTDEEFKEILTPPDFPDYELTPTLQSDKKCGFPCLNSKGEPETFIDSSGVKRQYMCGSVNYPNIKDPEVYALYEIISK